MKIIAAAAGAGLLAAAIPVGAAQMLPYRAKPQPQPIITEPQQSMVEPLPTMHADHLRPCFAAMEELGIADEFRARTVLFLAGQREGERTAQQQLMGVGFTVGACSVAERLAEERLLLSAE